MDPQKELEKFKSEFDLGLKDYLESKEEYYKNISPFVYQFLKDISKFTLVGGKRLRPALFYHSYMMFGGKDEKLAMHTSMFMELLQSFFLIHDDICDKSDLRRGIKTFHKTYEGNELFAGTGEEEHMGMVLGLFAGDFACQLAYEVISNSNINNEVKAKLVMFISQKINQVVLGQLLDTIMPFRSEIKEEDIFFVDNYKTATYTYELPIFAGAYMAGIQDENLQGLRDYTLNSGIAFQVYDDILGMFGNDEITGKPSSSDIKEGKITLLILKALELGSDSDKAKLKRYLGKKNISEEEVEQVRKIIIDTGSLNYSKNKCYEFVGKAQKALEKIDKYDENAYNFLYSIVEYSIQRNN